MPIYDQGYRHYLARSPLHHARFWPITREALRLLLAKRAFLGLLAVSFLPFVMRLIQVYLGTQYPQMAAVMPRGGALFGQFLNQQTAFAIPPLPTFTVLLSLFAGAGLVSGDLRTGGIIVYLARPLTHRDYVLGKLGVLLVLNLFVTLVPCLVLYGAALGLAPDQYAKWSLAWIAPAIVAFTVGSSTVLGLLALSASALSRSGRVAGFGFFMGVFGLELIRVVLQAAFGRNEAVLLSPVASLRVVCDALFETEARAPAALWASAAIVLALVSVGCLAVLRARVRAVEIVT